MKQQLAKQNRRFQPIQHYVWFPLESLADIKQAIQIGRADHQRI